MASEIDTSESLIVQARDEKDVDRRNNQCNITTANQKKENISFEDEPNTEGTKGDKQAKPNFKVGEGNNFDTDGECFLYRPSVEKVTNDGSIEQSEDCPEATLDNTENTILRSDNQQQATKKIATAEEAEEQPIESPALDAKAKETSEGTISCNEELKKEPYNEDEVSGAEKDQKGIPEVDGYTDHMDNFSSLEKETVEHPRKPAASPAVFEASVSEADSFEKASTAVVPGPEIMAETEKENTQKDEDKKMACSEKEDFNMSKTSNLTIDDNKESRSEIMKGLHEAGISPWESTDTVEEKKSLHEAGSDYNLYGESKSLCEKDFEEMTGSSNTLRNKIEPAYKNIESIAESQREEICRDKGVKIEEGTFSSSNESGISINPLQTAMVKSEHSEECTVEEMMLQEQEERKLLNEAFRLSSENNGSVEQIEGITSSNPCETNSWIDNSKAKNVEIHTFGIGNSDMADIHQEIKTEANLEVPADFTERIISSNEDDLCHGDNPIAKEERCGKQDVGFELQPDEKQEAKELILYEQVSEARRNAEFTCSDRKSDANTEKKIAGHTTRITEEDKTPEILEFEPERQEIQNQEEPIESKPKQQAPDSNLQKSRKGSTDKISNLMESMDKDIVNDERHLEMYIDDVTAKETINETVTKEMPSANIPKEISKEPYKLPNQQNDQSALEGSKLRNEAIFSVISREQNPQQEDQLNKSNDVTIGKANQAQENYDNSDTTELDLSELNIDIQKDSKSCQESRSDETNGADIVQDTDKNDNQIEEGNNDQVDENQSYPNDIEAQGLHGNMKDAIGMGSASATLSFDSIELTEGKDALTEVEIHNQENEDANTENNIASAKEIVKPVDAIESLGRCTKQDAACGNDVTSLERRKSESGENHVDSNEQCAVSPDFLLQENYDKDQAGCNAKTEILEAEDSARKFKEADEVVKEPNYNEEPQCIKEQAIENDVLNVMMKKEADDKEFEIKKSYSLQLHDDSSMQLIKVEAHERCELNEVQELENLESTRSEESSLDKAKENQESIEIYQSQNEIVNDGMQVTEAESTTDAQLQDPEDGTLYNSNIDVSAKQDTYTKSDSIGKQNDGTTHAQTAFMEIQETEGVNKEETRDEGTEETQESATYFGKQHQKIDEESASVMMKKEQCHEESDDPSNAKNGVSSYDIKRDDIAEEKWNYPNILEFSEQDIYAKPDSVEVLQDEKTHKQIGYDETSETKVVNNEEIMDHSSTESDSCCAIQKQETAEACTPTPQIKVEHTILSKDECTNIASENIQDSETQEDEARDKQVDDLETTKMGLNAQKSAGDDTLPKNENSINIWKEDIKAQISSIEMQKEAKTNEQTCSNESYETTMVKKEILNQSSEEQHCGAEDPDIITDDVSLYKEKTAESQITEVQKDEKPNEHSDSHVIHETKAASNEDCVAPNSKAVDFCCSKHDEELLKNIVTSKGKSTGISSEEYQVSEVKEEVTIGKQQCKSETMNPNKDVFSQMVPIVDVMIPPENEDSTNILETDIKTQQCSIEDLKDEKTNEQTYLNETHKTQAVENEENVNQSFENASRDECTRIYSAESDDGEKEGEGKASFDKEQCISKMDPRNINNGVCSYDILEVESLISENSMSTVEAVHQDTKADSYSMEAQDEITCNQIRNIEAVNNKESANQFFKVSDYAEEAIAVIEAETIVQNKEDHTMIPCEKEVLKLKEEAMVESQQFDAEEQNKMTNGIFSKEDKGIEIEQENEDSANMIDKKKAMIAELEKSEVQIDHSEAHETKVVNSEEIDEQCSEESNPCSGIQDQETAEATTLLLEDDGPLPSINEGTGISREDFDVSEVNKEPVTQDSNGTNATPPCQIEDEETIPGTQDSVTIVEDMIQVFNKSDNFELQRKEKAHEQMESSELQETQEVSNNKEILNQCSEDSDFPYGRQEEIFEPSKSLIGAQNLGPSNDECTMISSEKIQLKKVEQASPLEQQFDSETKDLNEMETRVSSYKAETVEKVPECSLTKVKDVQQDTIAGLQIGFNEIVPGNEKSMNIIEDMDQDIHPESKDTICFYGLIEAQKEDELNEQIASDEIHMTHEINNEEIKNECTKESNSYIGKQDQKIAESSTSLGEAEIQVSSKDECTGSSNDRIQLNEVKDTAAKEQQQCSSETENLNKITNSAYQFENIEPAAMKEMLTLELREANNAGNDAIDRSIKNHAGNDNMEKEKDVQQIDKENPGTDIQCKEYNVQQAIALPEANDEPEDEINIYGKEIIEEIEMPELSKSGKIEGSFSSTENEVRKDAIQVDDNNNIIPNQQTVIGTEASEEYASIGKSELDRGQSAKKSNVHTQTGFDAECPKHEKEGPESMNNSLEEEGEQVASNEEEISGVQNALAPESGLVKEIIEEEDKQGIEPGENKFNTKIMTMVKETTCSQEPLLERNAVKEVSLTEKPQHAGDRKEFPPTVDDLSIVAGKEDGKIQLTELDHVSREISLTELYEKLSVEDQELDHTKKEEKVPKATVPSTYCQDVNETTAEETIREEIWQANEQEDQVQESSSEHHGQKHGDTRMEEEDKSTSTMKVPREEKSHECSKSQKTYLSEEKKEHGESNSDLIPNLDSELKQVEDNVTTTDELAMTEPQDLSSDFQSINSISESETRPEYVVNKGSCSQETKNEDVWQLLQKPEQANDISGQHDSSSKSISENKIVHRSQIMGNVQGQSESFEQMTKHYVQEGVNSEEFDKETHKKTVNRELLLDANQSNEDQKEQKIAICDLTSTEVTEEANIISDESNIFESEATKESCQEASSAEETDYKVNSRDTIDNASGKSGGKNANIQDDGQVQKPENQFELTEPDQIDGSSSQNPLLQGDIEALEISTTVETQQTNTMQMFSPTVEEPEILSAQDAKDIINGSELEEDSRDVSAREIKANQSTEKELNDAEREIKFPNLTAVHMNVQDVDDTTASYMFQANETEEPHKTSSCKHLEDIYGTSKPVCEMEEKENETSSENLVHETHLPESEQRECEVLSSKDDPIKDSTPNQELAEKGQTVIESTQKAEDSSLDFGVTSSTSEEKSWTEPMSNLDGSSQVIENKNKWQDSKILVEIPNVSPPIESSSKLSTKYHDHTECSQQVSEPLGEEQTDSDETHQEMCHQLKLSQLISEDKSPADFGAHEATGNEDKQDKNTVLHTDPTLAQQNMSFGREEMTVMVEEQETSTENNNSSVEGGEVVIATRQQLAERTDSGELCQFQNTKEDDNPHIQSIPAEKEQEVEENHDSLSVSSQFQDGFKNVLMEKTSEELADDIVASGDKRQLHDDSRKESEELNKNEACTQKSASITESETNGFSLLQPSDPVKESLKEATTDNPSIVKNKSGEHEHHDDPLETQAGLKTLDSAIPLSSNITQESSPQTSLSSNVEQEQDSLHNQPKHEGETALAKSKSDEEKQDEQEDSGLKVPLMSEAPRDMELKATHKKSHNILSGVGSKVKNSISKVKKVMACTTSQFTPEEVIIKLNKNKNLDKA